MPLPDAMRHSGLRPETAIAPSFFHLMSAGCTASVMVTMFIWLAILALLLCWPPGTARASPVPTPSDAKTDVPLSTTVHWRQWRGVLYRVVAPPALPSQAATAQQRERPVSFLLGTLHFGSLEELHLDADILRDALQHTRLFINEVPLTATPVTGQLPTVNLQAYRQLPPETSLQRLLGAEPFDALQLLLPQQPPEQLQRFKPWLALALLESRGESVSEHTLDYRLAQWAQAADIPSFHLETLAEQLQALDCVPAAEHVQVLRQRLTTPWLFEEQSARVLEYYRAGDLPAWLDEIDAMTGLDATARHIEQRARLCLIEARNAQWMTQLDALLRAGSAFVAVGAIHLTGESGLLASLQQRGFSIVAEPLALH